MATRTVRLDDETERILDDLVGATGLSISAVLKRGLIALNEQIGLRQGRSAHEIYEELDLGPGGYSIAPSTGPRPSA